MKLEVTKEKVLEAAKNCSQAKEALKILFPEAFEEDKYFDISKKLGTQHFDTGELYTESNGDLDIQIRNGGKYHGKGFYLGKTVDWEIVKDVQGDTILVPTRR